MSENLQHSTCNNCGQKTAGPYCANCGQRSSVHKVTFRETFDDLADQLFSLSAPLSLTIKMLVVNPGQLFREYLSGKRKKYYKPISFFLLTTLIFLFLRWAIDFSSMGQAIGDPNTIPGIDSELLTQARVFMVENINNLLFIFVFALALMLKLFFYKKYMLSEYLAVAFYLAGFYSIIGTINSFYIKYINPNVQYLAMLFMLVYFVYAMVSFFQDRKFVVAIKSVFIYFFSYLLYAFLGFYFSYLIVWLKQS